MERRLPVARGAAERHWEAVCDRWTGWIVTGHGHLWPPHTEQLHDFTQPRMEAVVSCETVCFTVDGRQVAEQRLRRVTRHDASVHMTNLKTRLEHQTSVPSANPEPRQATGKDGGETNGHDYFHENRILLATLHQHEQAALASLNDAEFLIQI